MWAVVGEGYLGLIEPWRPLVWSGLNRAISHPAGRSQSSLPYAGPNYGAKKLQYGKKVKGGRNNAPSMASP